MGPKTLRASQSSKFFPTGRRTNYRCFWLALFFKKQYGLEVITPTLRPVLPWLALLDDKIRQRVMKVAPEVLLEGGDPSELHLEIRRKVLPEVADQIVAGDTGRSYRHH